MNSNCENHTKRTSKQVQLNRNYFCPCQYKAQQYGSFHMFVKSKEFNKQFRIFLYSLNGKFVKSQDNIMY